MLNFHRNVFTVSTSVMRQVTKTNRRARDEEKEKRKKVRKARRNMDALAKKLGKWDPQTTIRKFRDSNLKGES